MHYRIRKDKIFTASPTSGLLVLHRHVVLCDGPKLQLCAFNCGDTRRKEREWILEAPIVFMQCDGGPPGREAVLVVAGIDADR